MKKILSLLLALVLVFSLAGCQASGTFGPGATTDGQSTVTETSTVDTAVQETTTQTETTTSQVDEPLPPQTETHKPVEGDGPEQEAPTDQLPQEEPTYQEPQDEPTETTQPEPTETDPPETETQKPALDPNGYYNTKDEVALYIHLYGRLPGNYITKSQAKSQYGSTSKIPSNKNIGGDRFYNKEGLLPSGHTYYECDIGTYGGSNRGTKRIVFSSDGLIYYTSNHYGSFTLLYGG